VVRPNTVNRLAFLPSIHQPLEIATDATNFPIAIHPRLKASGYQFLLRQKDGAKTLFVAGALSVGWLTIGVLIVLICVSIDA